MVSWCVFGVCLICCLSRISCRVSWVVRMVRMVRVGCCSCWKVCWGCWNEVWVEWCCVDYCVVGGGGGDYCLCWVDYLLVVGDM